MPDAEVVELGRVHKKKGQKTDWLTPPHVCEAVYETLGDKPDLDPCSNPWSIVEAGRKISRENGGDGPTNDWPGKTFFTNPPFGPRLGAWVGRCVHARRSLRMTGLLLLPVSTETKWWQRMIFPTATAVCFPDHGIAFLDPETLEPVDQPPMTTGIVYWGGSPLRFSHAFRSFGQVLHLGVDRGRVDPGLFPDV